MKKEPCTKFHGLQIRIHEVIELQSFKFSVSDVIPANVQNISPLVFYRRSHRRCSVIKGVVRNLAKFTGKHLCQRLLFNKVAGLLLFLCFCQYYVEKSSYKVDDVFEDFSQIYLVAIFSIIELYLDVIDVIHAHEHIKYANCVLCVNF